MKILELISKFLNKENIRSVQPMNVPLMYELFDGKTEQEKEEPERIYSELDPYGEENWEEEDEVRPEINWNIVGNNQIRRVYKIPVGGLSREDAERQIQELMSEYHEEVIWDEKAGTYLDTSGQTLPFSKDYWFPTKERDIHKWNKLIEDAKYMY